MSISEGVPWIQTHLGIQFIVLEPRFENIHIGDIAHALSMNCRFNGHCKDFYSVAEHSVHVSRILDDDPNLALWGLLHDASEAYITDLPRPVKNAMPQFEEIEERYLSNSGHYCSRGGWRNYLASLFSSFCGARIC